MVLPFLAGAHYIAGPACRAFTSAVKLAATIIYPVSTDDAVFPISNQKSNSIPLVLKRTELKKTPTDWLLHKAAAAVRKPPSLAVARNCGIGSSSLNAEVKALDRLHIVLGWNSSCCGLKWIS